MTRTVECQKYHESLKGLVNPPFPGPLGERIYQEISEKAWQDWLNHQTMLINEYRLALIDPKARAFLQEEMEKFFFGEGSAKPHGYTEK